MTRSHFAILLAAGLSSLIALGAPADRKAFRFAIAGDRSGEAQPGVYEQAWREISAAQPDFVVTTGDAIQGLNDGSAPAEWAKFERMLEPYKRYPVYAVAGNHDIWSASSERLFQQHTGRSPHYSFDYGDAHFTVLDNSRTEQLSAGELSFLEADLKAHAAKPRKFIFAHRPSWILNVALRNPDFPLHQLARRYGVQYVVAGHLHQLLRFEMEGVTYVSMPSTGGHLRASGEYVDGWFFGYALVSVSPAEVDFRILELKPPHGDGRATKLADWGILGLVNKSDTAAAAK